MKQKNLQSAIDDAILFASRRMVIFEQLIDKSPDYRRGFFDGVEHETDFMIALLSPAIAGLRESIEKLEKKQSRQS